MALIPFDPFRSLRRRDDDFENMFREFFKGAAGEGFEPPVLSNGMLTVKVPKSAHSKSHKIKVSAA